jgi:hypothetical protein
MAAESPRPTLWATHELDPATGELREVDPQPGPPWRCHAWPTRGDADWAALRAAGHYHETRDEAARCIAGRGA